MEGELDPFDWLLAEKLGATIEEMQERLANREYLSWRAFYVYRDAMIAFEVDKANKEAKRRRR